MEMSTIANDQELNPNNKTQEEVSGVKSSAAMKESVMDFVGHFSTASAILEGFFMTTCAFIINIRAVGTDVFKF